MPELTTECRSMIEGRNFAYLGTIRSDGSAAVTPVWVDLADNLVVVNGVAGRAWTKHLIADPRVTVCVASLLNPYQCVTITGRVVAREPDDDAEHFAKLVGKYRGSKRVSELLPTDQQRVVFKIAVDRFGYRTEDPPAETRDLVASDDPFAERNA
jgi:PPOX class probable F420-dependent enzyme